MSKPNSNIPEIFWV